VTLTPSRTEKLDTQTTGIAPTNGDFPVSAPAANPVFYRTYSRRLPKGRESWHEVGERNRSGLLKLGSLNAEEMDLLARMQAEKKALPSGRWQWIGGTPWIEKPENFSGAYNCTSTNLVDWEAFGLMMDLAMMGCGTGAIIEPHFIDQLPVVTNPIEVLSVTNIGITPAELRQEKTTYNITDHNVSIKVGDTRRGWVDSYQLLLELSSDPRFEGRNVKVDIDLSDVRPVGETLKGFGGMANPVKLKDLYGRVAKLLGKAIGRKLTSIECCLLIDEAAVTIVAGNIRRSAGMRQFASDDTSAAGAKENLWKQDSEGNWRIDPERDALRMANHTRVYHTRPSRDVLLEAVTRQFHSGEGAIQFAPEALARSNADLLSTQELRSEFIEIYCDQGRQEAGLWLQQNHGPISEEELEHRLSRYGLNPCGEILGADFHCNLAEVHLNQIDPEDEDSQRDAFRAGRPETEEGLNYKKQEAEYLKRWKSIVNETVWDYCDRHDLRRPNRCTTVQPAGTKSLLTGAAPGWHPPKAQRFIRRITFRKNDPVAMACMDYGYTVVPSQSDKDDQGRLLNDPFDTRCTEWLVEIPTEVSWANLPGADTVDINAFSALAQFDFYMQVQSNFTAHNTSATIEFREHEIEPLTDALHQTIQQGGGYISAALLARFDANATFPRLPFEPIDAQTYERMQKEVIERRVNDDFFDALQRYDNGELTEAGPAGCDSDKCLLPLAKPNS